MKSKLFDHFVARAILAVMLVWSFLTIYLVAGFGAGEIAKLVIISPRAYWRIPQAFAWLGLSTELVALGLVWSPQWRKAAYLSTACLTLSATLFLLHSDDLRFITQQTVFLPIGIFIAACILRVMQLRRKSRMPAAALANA